MRGAGCPTARRGKGREGLRSSRGVPVASSWGRGEGEEIRCVRRREDADDASSRRR